jgi:hypothetical protein
MALSDLPAAAEISIAVSRPQRAWPLAPHLSSQAHWRRPSTFHADRAEAAPGSPVLAAAYNDSFAGLNAQAPPPAADEAPGTYRRRLFSLLQSRLSPRHELYGLDPNQMDRDAITVFERDLHEAAKREADTPSYDNLPRDGLMIERHRVDPNTNLRTTEFYGRRSFIADMGLPGQLVTAFNDTKNNRSAQPENGWRWRTR